MKTIIIAIFLTLSLNLFAQRKDYLITLHTNLGDAHLILFNETPLHKQNFINLVKSNFYDSLLFHRVIKGFMIQGGDPLSINPDAKLGEGGSELAKIPFEFNPNRIHIKGALAAARDENHEKMSSGCQFYLVQGGKIEDNPLKYFEIKNGLKYTVKQKIDYMIVGGTPFLDNNYTVFGTLIDNFDLIDKIANETTNANNKPLKNIKMSFSIKKLRKSKITKKYGYNFD